MYFSAESLHSFADTGKEITHFLQIAAHGVVGLAKERLQHADVLLENGIVEFDYNGDVKQGMLRIPPDEIKDPSNHPIISLFISQFSRLEECVQALQKTPEIPLVRVGNKYEIRFNNGKVLFTGVVTDMRMEKTGGKVVFRPSARLFRRPPGSASQLSTSLRDDWFAHLDKSA